MELYAEDVKAIADVLEAARDSLRGGEHEGPCDSDVAEYIGCGIHSRTADARKKRLRAALASADAVIVEERT